MKKLILIMILLSVVVKAQNWNSIVTTSIDVSNVTYIESHADKDGIHIVTLNSNHDIKYYLINSNGSTIRSSTISTNGDYPNIVGDESAVFVVYREGSYIRVKRTTDAGASWSQRHAQSIGSNPCSGIDAAIDYRGIHVVWSIGDANGYNMETNYKRFVDGPNNWYDFYTVTNYAGGYGTSPTVSLSPDRVHVGYNSSDFTNEYYTFDENEMSRTKYNNNWQTQQTIALNESGRGKIFAASSKLYDFYYDFVSGMGQFHSDLYFKNRNYGSTTWSSSTLLEGFSDVTVPLVLCETANEYIHAFTVSGKVKERVIIDGSVGSATEISSSGTIYCFGTSSVYNDIYIVWKRSSSTYLEYRQYDANPQIPQSFAGQNYNNKPKLTWEANKEPDIQYYEVWRQIRLVGEFWGNWVLLGTTTSTSFIDNDIWLGGGHVNGWVRYKIRAKDKHNHLSGYTNYVQFTFYGLQKPTTQDEEQITEYVLFSNYPNPFNPSTTISYQLPKESFVNLTVYNSLGQEVAVLVNETQVKGKYSVKFNANSAEGELPSGLYFYRLQCGEFNSVRKMILTK